MKIVTKKALFLEKEEKEEFIRVLKAKNIQLKDLAKEYNCSLTYVSLMLNGERPITDKFKATLEYFMIIDEE